MKKHVNINICGLVQGVFFRVSAKQQADKLNITGFARNEPDGSVYIEAEGQEKDLDKFIKWCNIGPTLAEVEKIITSEGSLKNFKEFYVKQIVLLNST